MKKYKKALIRRVNMSIQKANAKRFKLGLPITKPLGENSINKAVAIARHPGPTMDFEAGELDAMLELAGFSTKKRRIR